MAKNVNSRMRQKCDIKANWDKATSFRPLDGEVIVISDAFTYQDASGNSIVTPGVKIGRLCDGTNYVATSNTSQGENFLLSELPYLNADGKTIVKAEETDDGFLITFTDGSTIELKNGAQGPQGLQGEKGEDGYTPVRGTDYWTEDDKAEIKTYVDDAILNGEW